jgi:subtilisin family serine protease
MGPFMFSDGAAGRNVLGIAATEPDYIPQSALEVSFTYNGTINQTRMGHIPKWQIPWPSTLKDVPVVHVGSGCKLPDGIDLTDTIALVERWFCSPVQKEKNILAAGGKYIFIFDPVEPDRDGFYLGDWTEIVFASLVEKDGQALAAALGEGYSIKVSVPDSETVIGMENPRSGTPSYFTSFGPTFDHAVKPDIGAPGSGILSLYLDHSFAAMDGTSMATPYVAGVAALYIGKHGGRSKHGKAFGRMLSARILSSGSSIAWADHLGMPMDSGIAASVAQAGNGLVNATKMVMSETQLSFTKFALNDTHQFSRYQGVEITNNSPEPVTYTFDVEAAGAFEALEWSAGDYPQIPSRKSMINDVIDIAPEVRMPAGTHRLAPGQTKRVE